MDQSSGRNTIERSQPDIGNHVEMEEEKEAAEGDYEEIDKILNGPFAMEYNMSYSAVIKTAAM